MQEDINQYRHRYRSIYVGNVVLTYLGTCLGRQLMRIQDWDKYLSNARYGQSRMGNMGIVSRKQGFTSTEVTSIIYGFCELPTPGQSIYRFCLVLPVVCRCFCLHFDCATLNYTKARVWLQAKLVCIRIGFEQRVGWLALARLLS